MAAITVIVLLAGVLVALELTNITHIFHKDNTREITSAGDIKTPTPSSSSKTTPVSEHKDSGSAGRSVGGSTDTKGLSSAQTDPGKWITSKSGNITVKQPTANSTLKSGDILSGTAKVGPVHFRLIDNASGVIAQGELDVVDGRFSGKLGFGAESADGRLDVFSTDSEGVELNEIQIAVRF